MQTALEELIGFEAADSERAITVSANTMSVYDTFMGAKQVVFVARTKTLFFVNIGGNTMVSIQCLCVSSRQI